MEQVHFQAILKKTKDITELLSGAKLMECSPMAKGYASEFPDEMIQVLGNENLDFILRFGFNILRGKVLDVARFGIWSFHHDDEQEIRGGYRVSGSFTGKQQKTGLFCRN